ncbi:hypothetical protein Rhopal_004952-T1 [Rhodotorula paludigena]|uniref:Sulfatase N-terminal domain-containing protein n=1 Tax=Rhodotorula paludigena TaxID=86838 RepID=A0AAV5GSB6_9BASI|nr:hypothetical protein Rhopal_004952-T1 [Rhodotorula paludigena]
MPHATHSGLKQPNILFVMADDHAAKAIGAYGAGINSTPHLDRLAKEGMRMDHCYVTNSICTPSRATILTGTHNHTNLVTTLDSKIDKNLPNVAKHLRSAGYQTAMIGKWHLGEGKAHEPTGFDTWDILPGQGQYFDPIFINSNGMHREAGYATDIITDKTLDFIRKRDPSRPFFAMCHHKAPHRSWECDPKHRHLYKDPVKLPETFTDDYKNRARAAAIAKMRVESDMSYGDLGLSQPEGGSEVGDLELPGYWFMSSRKVPMPDDVTTMRPLVDRETGEQFTFKTREELSQFKYQRYMQRYLRCIQSIDDNMGRTLDFLEAEGLAENTIVIYTSDQGFFLGEHGWFDKRFIYEESFQMPFLVRWPAQIAPGSVCGDIVSNVDFAPTWLEAAGVRIPTYMQGDSFLSSLKGVPRPEDDQTVAYHRYWMHNDSIHNAYAHYGIRNQRYKLIYWYNEGFGLPGTGAGGQEREWELFDCDEDPLELFNVWSEPRYANVREDMVRLLNDKMEEIGDTAVHELRVGADKLDENDRATQGTNLALKSGQKNL